MMLRWIRVIPALVGVGLLLGSQATLFADPRLPMSESREYRLGEEDQLDHRFVQAAVQAGMTEIEWGEIAMKQASTEAIRDFASRFVDEHRSASKELSTIAKRQLIDAPMKVTNAQRRTIDRLKGLWGSEFDRAFLTEIVKSHNKSIDLYEKEANFGGVGELRLWASKMVTTLRNHRTMAMDLAGMPSPSAATSSYGERR